MDIRSVVKVKVLKGFTLRDQGYYRRGAEVTLHLERDQAIGVLTPARYKKLLERGIVEPIEEEVSDGKVLT